VIVAECDVGSATGKALTMSGGEIASFPFVASTARPEMTAQVAANQASGKAGLVSDELDRMAVTH
jgi:hypothetical protein